LAALLAMNMYAYQLDPRSNLAGKGVEDDEERNKDRECATKASFAIIALNRSILVEVQDHGSRISDFLGRECK
jgi:hypothetical protein